MGSAALARAMPMNEIQRFSRIVLRVVYRKRMSPDIRFSFAFEVSAKEASGPSDHPCSLSAGCRRFVSVLAAECTRRGLCGIDRRMADLSRPAVWMNEERPLIL